MSEDTTIGQNNDDQELAKALAGMNDKISGANDSAATSLAFEETPSPSGGAVTGSPFGDPSVGPVAGKAEEPLLNALPPMPEVGAAVAAASTSSLPTPSAVPAPASENDTDISGLEDIKKNALSELRPLVDKLNIPAEELFDTYLLLLRSTDDAALIGPAHNAAKAITDEARRAQALLDIIKEIDYLSAHDAAA